MIVDNYDIYEYPLYRPPSEAYSLILQVTLGCSHNKCVFCGMYRNKKFRIKSLEDIKKEMLLFRGMYRNVDRIFLADGDALIVPTKTLIEILNYIKEIFPECERVSVYGTAVAVNLKSEEDLKELKKHGLSLIYLGVESGDDETLKFIKKGVKRDKIVEMCHRVKRSGIQLSITLIAGILGKGKDSTMHAINSGKIISEIAPEYVGILTLRIYEDTELFEMYSKNEYDKGSTEDIVREVKIMLENINIPEGGKGVIFRCNHASNSLPLKGTLPQDKERLVKEITEALDTKTYKRNVFNFL